MECLNLGIQEHRDKLYKSKEWRSLREHILNENPLCVECLKEGQLIPGNQIDHIIPIQKRPDLALDPSNLQVLCTSHHAKKTISENSGFAPKKVKVKTYNTKWNLKSLRDI